VLPSREDTETVADNGRRGHLRSVAPQTDPREDTETTVRCGCAVPDQPVAPQTDPREDTETAATLADRLSINLEAPIEGRLQAIAPKKQFAEELVRPLQWLTQYRAQKPHLRHASTTTQFVVGTGETDLELLATAAYLH
jgi:hypothetical protein